MVLRLTPECVVLQGNRAFVDFSGAGSARDAGLLWQALLGPAPNRAPRWRRG